MTQTTRLPAWLKWVYLGYIVVLVPAYLYQYGPIAFLWFSNVALLLGLVGVWTENRLLLSTQAVSISLLELGWLFGFVGGLLSGGHSPFGLTDYMFDEALPLWLRGLSPVLHKFRPVFGLSGLFQGIENMQHILFDDRIGAH